MHAGLGPTLAYFNETFGFTERETVALLGVHSLGVARCGRCLSCAAFH